VQPPVDGGSIAGLQFVSGAPREAAKDGIDKSVIERSIKAANRILEMVFVFKVGLLRRP
jgi:hypothetical protein